MSEISDFDFERQDLGETQASPFMEKMEQVRLSRPCPLAIDMRGKVAGLCKAYDYNGRTFFMDDASIKIFEDHLKAQKGIFTQAAYEAIQNGPHTLKAIRDQREQRYIEQKQNAAQQKPRLSIIDFGLEHKRKQARFELTTHLVVKTANNTYFGTTKDISLNGLYALIPLIYSLNKGDTVYLSFVNDRHDYVLPEELDKLPKIPYQIIRLDEKGERLALALQRIINPVEDLDKSYLKGVIQSKKDRLRSDNKELVSHQNVKAYRRYYSDSSTSVSLFYQLLDGTTQLIATGISQENHHLHDIFSGKNKQYDYSVLNDQRWVPALIQSALERGLPSSCIVTLYRLHGEEGNRLHVLSSEQLQSLKPFSLIWNYLKDESLFKVFRLTMSAAPNFPSDRIKEIIEPIMPYSSADLNMVDATLATIDAVGILSDITEEVTRAIAIRATDIERAKLKALIDKNITTMLFNAYPENEKQPKQIEFGYQRKRIEHRYQVELPVTVTLNETDYDGVTIDLSRRGLQLKLKEASEHFYKGQRVTLRFNSLLKRTSVSLKHVPYKVVSVQNGSRLKLSRFSYSKEDQQVDSFFERLIERNIETLALDMDDLYEEVNANLFEEMMSAALQSIPLFFVKGDEGKLQLDTIAVTLQHGGVLDYFRDSHNHVDLSFLSDLGTQNFLRESLRGSEHGRTTIVILSYRSIMNGELVAVLERELSDPEDLREFINQMVRNKTYRVLQLSVRYLPYYNELELQKMIMPIYSKSLSSAKRVMMKLEKLTVIGDINDITKEYFVALRSPLERQRENG